MESIEYIKSQRSIDKKDLSKTKSELAQFVLYLMSLLLFIGSIYFLVAGQNVLYLELAKATAIISLVLFIYLASKDSSNIRKEEA